MTITPAKKKAAKSEAKHFQVELPRRVFRRVNRQSRLAGDQPGKEELVRRMRRFTFFAKLPLRVVKELAAAARVGVFRTGEYIWHRDEQDRQVIFIESGFVKGARRTKDGVSRTYGLFGPGDSMGLFAIWSGMRYPTDALAMSDGMVAILVESAAMVKFGEKYPRLAGVLRNEMGRFTEAFIQKIEIVSAGTVPQRLAVLMAQLIDRYGVEKSGESARLPIALTLEQISEIVGARLETVARVLGEWKRAGWLRIDSSGCHFSSLDKVRELVGD